MTQTVIADDGTTHEFPDEATPEMMAGALNVKYANQQPSVSEDVAKSVGSNIAQGALSVPLGMGNLGNSLVAGPQLLGRGVASGIDKMIGVPEQPRGELWQPFYDSGNAAKDLGVDYQPKTAWGAAASIPAQVLGSLGGAKILSGTPELLQNENSGVSTGLASGGITSAADKLAPTLQTRRMITDVANGLQNNKNIAYQNGKNLGAVLNPQASDHVAITVPAIVEQQLGVKIGPGDPTYSQTYSALSNLQGKAAQGLTTSDIEQTRQRLNDILNGSSSGGDRTAAIHAKKALDGISSQIEQDPTMLINQNPESIQAFRDARGANSLYQRYSDIADIVKDARSNPQKIQTKFQKLVDSKHENDFARYDPDEQSMIEQIAYPNGMDTKLQSGGMVDKAVHGVGMVGSAGMGYAAGEALGHPVAGALVGGVSGATNSIRNTLKGNSILTSADKLLSTIASKSQPITPVAPSSPPVNAPIRQYPSMGFQADPEILAREKLSQ